jgi:hypothetical protein
MTIDSGASAGDMTIPSAAENHNMQSNSHLEAFPKMPPEGIRLLEAPSNSQEPGLVKYKCQQHVNILRYNIP